jgi:hypothetical protein
VRLRLREARWFSDVIEETFPALDVFTATAFAKRRQAEMGIQSRWRVEAEEGGRWAAVGYAPGGRNVYRFSWSDRSQAVAMVAALR